LSLFLSSCVEVKDDGWKQYCQKQYDHCKARERSEAEPACKALYGLVQDCHSYGKLVRNDNEKCAEFSANKAQTARQLDFGIGLGLAIMCQGHCIDRGSQGFPSYSTFEKDTCTIPPEHSKCTPCS